MWRGIENARKITQRRGKNMFSFSPPSSLLYVALDRPSLGPWRDLDQDPHWATLWEDSWIWIWLYTENVDSYLDLGWILKQKISFYSKNLTKSIFLLLIKFGVEATLIVGNSRHIFFLVTRHPVIPTASRVIFRNYINDAVTRWSE